MTPMIFRGKLEGLGANDHQHLWIFFVFIDSRALVYSDVFLKRYLEMNFASNPHKPSN